MLIKNYYTFTENLLLESMILESRLEFSDRFLKILNLFKKTNKIAIDLININKSNLDSNFVQNYIDISKQKDEVTFTPDRRAQAFLSLTGEPKFKVIHADKYLTNSRGNSQLFNDLGYTPDYDSEPYTPELGTVGKIMSEAQSSRSQRIYCYFVADDGRETAINKDALVSYNPNQDKIWGLSRSSIKIGRLVRSILNVSKIEFTDKEIEDFVNLYKSSFDILDNAFSRLKIVKGEDIKHWYNMKNYESSDSTLGNSCMAEVNPSYFDIYSQNSNCSLIIMFSKKNLTADGTGKLSSDKICGRALVWNTEEGDTFMDRIYTNRDSDIDIFKQYAQKNEWFYKTVQNSGTKFSATNGIINKAPFYTVKLEKSEFAKYPYLDTLLYINFDTKILTNDYDKLMETKGVKAELESTSGRFGIIYEDD